jgi:hypothetical protein
MWTWYYHMDKNLTGINPFFAVDQRTCLRDRTLIITRSSDIVEDLTYRGCNMPSFYYTPSCFNLMINQFGFTNISFPFLLARDLGLPYPVASEFMEGGQATYSVIAGSGTVQLSTLTQDFPLPCTKIYQPIWKDCSSSPMYENEFVRTLSLDHAAGIGQIFLERSSTVTAIRPHPSTDWVPDIGLDTQTSRYLLSKAVITLQDRLDGLAPSSQSLPEEERRQRAEILRTNHETNLLYLAELDKRWKERSPI